MQVGSGVKVAFQAQASACPLLGGLVFNQAAYCPRVTSVASMAKPGTGTAVATQRVRPELSVHSDSCGEHVGAWVVPPVAEFPPRPLVPPPDEVPPVASAPPVRPAIPDEVLPPNPVAVLAELPAVAGDPPIAPVVPPDVA